MHFCALYTLQIYSQQYIKYYIKLANFNMPIQSSQSTLIRSYISLYCAVFLLQNQVESFIEIKMYYEQINVGIHHVVKTGDT